MSVIARVAVVPHPPLLVPELVSGAAAETESLRAACLAVAAELAGSASNWVAVATDPTGPTAHGPESGGTFRGFGVDVRVSLSDTSTSVDPALPLPVLVAGWLRERAGADSVRAHVVPPALPVTDCAALGARLARELDGPDPVGLLVLGDGSRRHGEHSVGRPDERSGPFDESVRKALATADPDALLALDPGLAAELGADGRAAWQVLGGVGGRWRCSRSEFVAPYGVGYHLALWDADPS